MASTIPEVSFPFPTSALLGGVVIGFSAASFVATFGRVLGISGHLSRSLTLKRPADVLLPVGLGLGGFLLAEPAALPSDGLGLHPLVVCVAGALVGLGTTLGNGCTSGHGVCGMSRLSRRSFAAVGAFMATAAVTARLAGTSETLRAAMGATPSSDVSDVVLAAAGVIGVGLTTALASYTVPSAPRDMVIQLLLGATFAVGLVVSKMAVPLTVSSFFDVGGPKWDPSLLFVFPGALTLAGWAFWRAESKSWTKATSVPSKAAPIDGQLLLGSALFGVGWGMAGMCPGPALVLAGASLQFLRAGDAGLASLMAIYMAAYAVGVFAAPHVSAALFPPARKQGAGNSAVKGKEVFRDTAVKAQEPGPGLSHVASRVAAIEARSGKDQ